MVDGGVLDKFTMNRYVKRITVDVDVGKMTVVLESGHVITAELEKPIRITDIGSGQSYP